ncbi:MAG: DUF58 domain-containing protein [Firmicutes bacterium]|nr:DUF58 domain-containing protein [Bacillota bacterium]
MGLWRFLSLLAVITAFLFETKPAYSLAYVVVFLFFGWRYFQERIAKGIVVRRLASQLYLFPGEQQKVYWEVENKSWFPFAWLSGMDGIPQGLVGTQPKKRVFSLTGRSVKRVAFQLTARQRGVFLLGPIELFVGDFFGITTQRFLSHQSQMVVVYPQILQLGELNLPSRLAFGNFQALQRIYPDPTRLAGVRPYQAGDPLRTLHWPATARTNSLQVKQFDHTVKITCLICLNFDERDYEVGRYYVQTELAVNTAASLANHLLLTGAACGLTANGVLTRHLAQERIDLQRRGSGLQVAPRRGVAQLTQLLTILAGIQTQSELDFQTLLFSQSGQYEFGTLLFWIVPKDSSEIMEKAWSLVRRGHQVFIFVVGDTVQHAQFLDQPKQAGLQIFLVQPRKGALL